MLKSRGFTLVELMVTLAVLGVLAAIAIPNYISASNRAKEASLKANMHAMQFVAEDYLVKGGTNLYADHASELVGSLQSNFDNPFDESVGEGHAWEDRVSVYGDPNPVRGITSYADSSGMSYNVKGYGAKSVLSLVLDSGVSKVRAEIVGHGLPIHDGGDPIKMSGPTKAVEAGGDAP